MQRLSIAMIAAIATAVTVVMVVRFQGQVPIRPASKQSDLTGAIDFNAIFRSIDHSQLHQMHARFVQPPSRLSGTLGDRNVSTWIEREFTRLGMKVFVQRFPVTVPVTQWCRLTNADGHPVPRIRLVPFWPNLVRTATTGPGGIVGQVIDVGRGEMEDFEHTQVSGKIALVAMRPGLNWLDVAKFGALAVLFRYDQDAGVYNDKFLNFPADLPRFLVTGPAERLIDKRVRIEASVTWRRLEACNIFGILNPPRGQNHFEPDPIDHQFAADRRNAEALTLVAHTDSWSAVPDLAPGYHDACGITALTATARALTAQRQGLGRTTIFAALSGQYQQAAGSRQMTDALGAWPKFNQNAKLLRERRKELARQVDALRTVAAVLSKTDYWALDEQEEMALWAQHDPKVHEILSSVIKQLLSSHIGLAQQKAAQTKVAWIDAGRPATGLALQTHRRASHRLRRAVTALGTKTSHLKQFFGDVLDASQCRDQLELAVANRLLEAELALRYQDDTIGISKILGRPRSNYFFFLAPSSLDRQLGYKGDPTLCDMLERGRDAIVATWLRWRGLPAEDTSTYPTYMANLGREAQGSWSSWPAPGRRLTQSPSSIPQAGGHAAFSFSGRVNPKAGQTPVDTQVDFAAVTDQVQLLAGLTAQIAAGAEPMGQTGKAATGIVYWFSDFGGNVMSRGHRNALLPDQPVSDAIAVLKGAYGSPLYIQKTTNGFFRFPSVEARSADYLMAEAYTMDPRTGQMTGARDLGPEGTLFPTMHFKSTLFSQPETRVTVLMARFAPTDLYRLLGPDGRALTLNVIDARFLSPMPKVSLCEYWEEGATVFVEPGERFYLMLKDLPRKFFGQKGLYTKGFLHGHLFRQTDQVAPDSRGWGPGYLAGHDTRIVFQEADAAISVARRNRQQLKGQIETGVADPVTTELAGRAQDLLQQGLDEFKQRQYHQAYRDLTASLAISARVYPTIQAAVYDAVTGILLYLFLLVPFSFFAERLLFSFSDIRARLGAIFGMFMIVFLAIRLTHPAYRLITSSMVILVGFIILILCILIMGFVTGKFVDRIRALRQMSGGVESDMDVSRLGAAGAAFGLGVSNMRKRKVRTAYTILTLILISFCLVCFTAPRPQLRERQIAVGRAGFDGLVIRQAGDISAVRARFSGRGEVIARRTRLTGTPVSYQPPQGPVRNSQLKGMVQVQIAEAKISGLDQALLPGGVWFGSAHRDFCYLSDTTADQLGIDPATVRERNVHVILGGRRLNVFGVFDSAKLDTLRDADGESFLPEIARLQTAKQKQRAKDDQLAGRLRPQSDASTQYVPAAEVALLPLASDASGEFTSAVVLFANQTYGSMREVIGLTLDRAPTFVRYAIDGLAFLGVRLRSVGLEGYVDIVVPLLVASCIVFNTMLGNVHERRGEISIYSAVGLSPRHVFYLFLAESLVYAVIGVVGGYLAALALQWLSLAGGDFLGLAIDYSSRSAIYVSLTLMFAVIISSFVPAYQAARVASPSERVGWELPTPIAPGQLQFELPFTYLGPDILAAVPFLTAWFDSRGEDSSGEFAADPPRVQVKWLQSHGGKQPVFSVTSTVWMRPYDLGVSQRVRVTIEPSDEPTIYGVHLRIDQLTGSDASWRRTNGRFISLLRRHLLSWRTVSVRRKQQLFEGFANGLDRASASNRNRPNQHDKRCESSV